MQVTCDSCDENYFNRIFDPDATVEAYGWDFTTYGALHT